MKKTTPTAATAIALALALAGAPAAAFAAETVKVAIPQRGAWDTSFTELGVGQGFFQKQGLDVQPTYTQGGASNEQAVISGSVDIAIGTGFLGILAAYVKGAPVRIISPEATGAPDIFWYVKASSPIKSMKDLHGKTVSFSEPGSSSNLILLTLLQQAGVSDAKTVPVGAAPNGLPQVMTGQIDASWSTPPTGLKELQAKEIRMIALGNDSPEVKGETVRVNAANLAFLQAHRAAALGFLKAYKQSVDWAYSDPAALAAYAKLSGQPLEQVQYAFKTFQTKDEDQVEAIKGEDQVLAQALAAKRIPHAMTHDDIKGVYDLLLKQGS
ncbi:MAG TPA: ABC transporter substrate-binding protein [Stellaceae bacterium]|nr:ABC transporter substrate-binding protein [Stellaceae bacterium]